MKCLRSKFWLEYPPNLLCSYDVLPLDGMSISQQMNALTRLTFAVFLVLLIINWKYSFLFLLLATLFIIILYYIQKKNMEAFRTENFSSVKQHNQLSVDPKTQNVIFNNPTSKRFCNDEKQLDGINGAFNNPTWISANQKLVGPPNPKTKIAPIIVPPSSDLSYWKANNMVVHSAINDETQIDVYKSGYQVSTCCPPGYPSPSIQQSNPIVFIKEQYDSPEETQLHQNSPNPHDNKEWNKQMMAQKKWNKQERAERGWEEGYEYPYLKTTEDDSKKILVRPNEDGWVNTTCGYDPNQLFVADLPTNVAAGNCARDPVMKEFNNNLYTQTIQPNVYTRSEINEPINANIGISYDQQFLPKTCTTDPVTGEINYIEHDPRIIEPAIVEPNLKTEITIKESNVYDPRFSGYGTSYRTYTDEQLGQPKFYYDDVDAIRMPNYIVRSNIDHQPFADQYGPIPDGNSTGNKFNPSIQSLANDAFLTATIQQRTELQERLMRKRNNEMSQLREAPLSTNQRMSGGMGCGPFPIA